MRNSIVIILIINCILLISCAKDKRIDAVKKAKDFENNLITAIKTGNFSTLKFDAINIIDSLNAYEKKCKDVDTSYTFNREYLLQTAAINERIEILKLFIENGVNPNTNYVIKNSFDIDKISKDLKIPIEDAIDTIKQRNNGYIGYYENLGSKIIYNHKIDSIKLKNGTIDIKNTLIFEFTIEKYAYVMSKELGKMETVAVLEKYLTNEQAGEISGSIEIQNINDLSSNSKDLVNYFKSIPIFQGIEKMSNFIYYKDSSDNQEFVEGEGIIKTDTAKNNVAFRVNIAKIEKNVLNFGLVAECCTGVNCSKCSFKNGGCNCDKQGSISGGTSYCNHTISKLKMIGGKIIAE